MGIEIVIGQERLNQCPRYRYLQAAYSCFLLEKQSIKYNYPGFKKVFVRAYVMTNNFTNALTKNRQATVCVSSHAVILA